MSTHWLCRLLAHRLERTIDRTNNGFTTVDGATGNSRSTTKIIETYRGHVCTRCGEIVNKPTPTGAMR